MFATYPRKKDPGRYSLFSECFGFVQDLLWGRLPCPASDLDYGFDGKMNFPAASRGVSMAEKFYPNAVPLN
jgi:hypothetical protein